MLKKILTTCLFLQTCLSTLCANLSEDVGEMIEGQTQFAFSLYPLLETENANLAFSPYSISTSLALLYLGARGETLSQMQQVMHVEIDRKNIGKTSLALFQSLKPKKDNTYKLHMANAAWVDQKTFLLADFRYAIEEQFKAKLEKLNFEMAGSASKTINEWISKQTQGKIPDFISPEDIDNQTRLILTSAVYFQGEWQWPFDVKFTQDWPFHPTPDVSIPVKMLHQERTLPYYENELIQAVALPFAGLSKEDGRLACVVMQPKSAENWDTLINEIPEQFNTWIGSLTPTLLDVKLPKFQIDCRYKLNDALQNLGMEDAFDEEANFSGIDGLRSLVLSKVMHQTFVDLNENGVTAAAVTSSTLSVTSAGPNPPEKQMLVDHPFLFFLVDLKSKDMLFMGKISQPPQA